MNTEWPREVRPRADGTGIVCDRPVPLKPLSGVAPAVAVEEKPVTAPEPAELEQQPAGSTIRLEPGPDELTFTVLKTSLAAQ